MCGPSRRGILTICAGLSRLFGDFHMVISERTPWDRTRRLIDHGDCEAGCKYTQQTPVTDILRDLEIARSVADNAIRKMIRSAK